MDLKSKIPTYSKILVSFFFAILSIAVLIWINYQIISGWFGKDGPANLGSIEVSYVSMGKFILDLGFKTWAPFWYFGFPFHVFYTPLLPFFEAILSKFFLMPLWVSYRFLTGLAFILAPVSVFLLGWQLSKRVLGGLISGLLFSIGPTVFYFILESGEVFRDRISLDFWDPRRFTILVRWGEGPHLFSLIFVPLAGVFFARLLEKPKFAYLLLTCIFVGLTALSNAIGLFAVILLMGSMVFSKFAISKDLTSFKWIFLTGIVSLGLVSFWYNLTFISTFLREGGSSSNIIFSLFPWGWVVGILAVVLLYYFLRIVIKDFAVASCLLWFVIFFGVVGTYYFSAPIDEFYRRIEILPQALRYNVEVDLSLSLLVGVLFARLLGFILRISALVELVSVFVGGLLIVGSIWYIQPFLSVAKKSSSQVVNLNSTTEKKIAGWFSSHVNNEKGERVLAPGNYGFYLNWFNYVWQLRGGLFQASTHHWPDHIYYQLANGKDPQIAKDWLVASNLKYALITATGSGELYKEFKNLSRFDSLKPVYTENGDIIYEVPHKNISSARLVSIAGMPLKPPAKADDKEPLDEYVNWIESSEKGAEFKVLDFDHYQIMGKIQQGEGVQISMTSDSGWSARDATGDNIKIGKDPLGFLLLYPKAGSFEINLVRSISLQEWLGYLVSLATVLSLFWYGLFKKKAI